MEARRIRAASIAAMLVAFLGANYRSPNFIIQTADPTQAEAFGKTAEKLRRDLAVEWLGQPMPDWYQPCTMTVQVGPQLGAGGATTFLFDRGEVYGWRMNIQGSAERVLDSVLPHEITHMVYASYFRRPLPRWADEGGATTVECPSEQAKHRHMLLQFLRSGRGISFSQMFAMTEYPSDVMPLYAQGHSLADYLIQQGGRRKYIHFLADGMRDNQWVVAIDKWYGVKDLGALQNTWVAWVAQGCPRLQTPSTDTKPETQLASAGRLPRPEPNLVYHVGTPGNAPQGAGPVTASAMVPVEPPAAAPQRPVAARPVIANLPASPAAADPTHPISPSPNLIPAPQPTQPRKVILEWQGR